MEKEEIEIMLKKLHHVMNNFDDKLCDDMQEIVEEVRNYIHHLETKNKELEKGQQSLMQSRRKWKDRYYKERRKVKGIIDEIERTEKVARECIEERIVIADSDSLNYGRMQAHERDKRLLQNIFEGGKQ